MKPRLASPFLADRGARFAGLGFKGNPLPAAHASQAAVPAAEVSLSTSAAFSRFTESCVNPTQEPAAPLFKPPVDGAADLVLGDHSMILVIAIAAYERCSHGRAVELALAEYVTKIGAGPLARAVADERERVHGGDHAAEQHHGHGNCPADDLHAMPAFERSASRRYPGGGR